MWLYCVLWVCLCVCVTDCLAWYFDLLIVFEFDVCLVVAVCYFCSGVLLGCVGLRLLFACGWCLLVTGSTIADACGLSLLRFNSVGLLYALVLCGVLG